MITLLTLKFIGFGLIVLNMFLFFEWFKPKEDAEPIVYENIDAVPEVKVYW